jgi:hypothetical protein
MSDFFRSCVEKYLEPAGLTPNKLRTVASTFLEKSVREDSDDKPDPEETDKGELQPFAARVLMKVLYGARMARYDLLRPCCWLATRITKWSVSCDKALHRLMCYINSTLGVKMCGWVGDHCSKWELVVYSDADFAG